jgi:hypothetical protein
MTSRCQQRECRLYRPFYRVMQKRSSQSTANWMTNRRLKRIVRDGAAGAEAGVVGAEAGAAGAGVVAGDGVVVGDGAAGAEAGAGVGAVVGVGADGVGRLLVVGDGVGDGLSLELGVGDGRLLVGDGAGQPLALLRTIAGGSPQGLGG